MTTYLNGDETTDRSVVARRVRRRTTVVVVVKEEVDGVVKEEDGVAGHRMGDMRMMWRTMMDGDRRVQEVATGAAGAAGAVVGNNNKSNRVEGVRMSSTTSFKRRTSERKRKGCAMRYGGDIRGKSVHHVKLDIFDFD